MVVVVATRLVDGVVVGVVNGVFVGVLVGVGVLCQINIFVGR